MIARKTTTVSPKDLEEFDSAFRSFDKEALGRLDLDQLSGALGALGVAEIVSDDSLLLDSRVREDDARRIGGEKRAGEMSSAGRSEGACTGRCQSVGMAEQGDGKASMHLDPYQRDLSAERAQKLILSSIALSLISRANGGTRRISTRFRRRWETR